MQSRSQSGPFLAMVLSFVVFSACGGDDAKKLCAEPVTICEGTCVDIASDNLNCGGCGVSCGSSETCVAQTCTTICAGDSISCEGNCIDPSSDNRFCGAFGDCLLAKRGLDCQNGDICIEGICGSTCPVGTMECAGACIDPNTDRNFCGASDCAAGNMGTACDAGEVCNGAGACELNCQTGTLDCGGTCINPNTDNGFCGASGDCLAANVGVACLAGERCDGAGLCELSCQAGLLDCDGTCVDPNTNPNFCGATGDCLAANAGAVCGATFACDGTGSCVALDLDVIDNGSFESGDYTSWTLGAVGVFANVANGTPLNETDSYFDFATETDLTAVCAGFSSTNIPAALASDGTRAAFHGMNAIGSFRVSQDVTLPPQATTLSWEMAYMSMFVALNDSNHFFAVNIRDVQTDALLSTPFKTVGGVDPEVVSDMTTMTADISAHQGQSVRIEFQIESQTGCFTTVFDNFRTF